MKDLYRFEEVPFTSAEVERISGLSTTMQRDWRRRGILRKRANRQQEFSPREVAEIMVLRALAELTDQRLETAAAHAKRVAPFVLGWALSYRFTIAFRGPAEEEAEFRKVVESRDRGGLEYIAEIVGVKGRLLWYSVWRGGKWTETTDVRQFFDPAADRETGGIIVNLEEVGHRLADAIMHSMFVAHVKRKRATS